MVKIPASWVIDTMKVSGEPYSLCRQILTSEDALLYLDEPEDTTYDTEATPDKYSYFYPEKDIKVTPLVRDVELHYNFAAVFGHARHSYELHRRKISSECDSSWTRQDTLNMIRHDVYRPSPDLIRTVIKDPRVRKATFRFLAACERFDGDASEESDYCKAFEEYRKVLPGLGMVADDALLDEFAANFWTWYDKKPYVPQINEIVKLRLKDSDVELSEKQVAHFRDIVLSERDIDRRTILALEYAKWDRHNGPLLLGEIIESGIYTKYLLETWIAWRAAVQIEYLAPSSFATIPNNYYDRMRVKCMNTLLRHMQGPEPDKYDACLLSNLMYCEILHRQGSIVGNESMATLANLKYYEFVHPEALGRDYLKEEE